jgi:hypothetical protein
MERELYRDLYLIVWRLGQRYRSKNVVHCDARIVLVYFWAVLHDRPVYWACRKENWPQRAYAHDLPSPATMSRRLRRPAIQAFMDVVEQTLCRSLRAGPSHIYLDGKPLPVGGMSGDPDATNGYGAGKIARGYRLHAICDCRQRFLAWDVRPLDEAEHVVALELVAGLGQYEHLIADGNYDKNRLYDRAGAEGLQVVTPARQGESLGHRKHSPLRIAAYKLPPEQRSALLAGRRTIERAFGTLCSGASGLQPLPSWVRRLPRVRRWVQAKIIVNYLRARRRERLPMMA